ncbi:hypothetical protein KCMC57_up14880 [Kitasatospora sp. CMC57]|uniref:Integrase catalytic domain-containing protein n=1 Tax=Kitasatospora sp. CMC57 TaxID=3231513 RepID=A0AB33JXR0_9ACTN
MPTFSIVPSAVHALKCENTVVWLQGARDYGDPATCRRTVFAWLTRYNTRRRHSANGHLSPNEYERRHHTAKLTLAAVTTNRVSTITGEGPTSLMTASAASAGAAKVCVMGLTVSETVTAG